VAIDNQVNIYAPFGLFFSIKEGDFFSFFDPSANTIAVAKYHSNEFYKRADKPGKLLPYSFDSITTLRKLSRQGDIIEDPVAIHKPKLIEWGIPFVELPPDIEEETASSKEQQSVSAIINSINRRAKK
jgi:hypothetical protein